MKLHVEVGEKAEFRKTIREADLLAFAEITGDRDPIHVDEAYAARSRFGKRIAHGALVMGLLSTTASMISRRAVERGAKGVSVSLGYDRIRFLKPVFIDDALTATYEIESIDAEKGRSLSRIQVVNQHGEPCLVGTHVMRWLPPEESA
jgi:acyl dehydratase